MYIDRVYSAYVLSIKIHTLLGRTATRSIVYLLARDASPINANVNLITVVLIK